MFLFITTWMVVKASLRLAREVQDIAYTYPSDQESSGYQLNLYR